MNSDFVVNSIYNSKKKTKDSFIFPKISKAEATPPENKVFVRGASRKYNQQNIFKMEDEKKQKVKLRLEEDKLREFKNKQYQELQTRIAEMMRKHQQQLSEIEENQKRVIAQIDSAKKDQYQLKLGLWEIKNEIMNLNAIYLDQDAENNRLENNLQYQKGQQDEEQYEQQDEEQYEQQDEEQQDQEEGQYQQQGYDEAKYDDERLAENQQQNQYNKLQGENEIQAFQQIGQNYKQMQLLQQLQGQSRMSETQHNLLR